MLPQVAMLVMDQLLEAHGFISLNICSPNGLSVSSPVSTTVCKVEVE